MFLNSVINGGRSPKNVGRYYTFIKKQIMGKLINMESGSAYIYIYICPQHHKLQVESNQEFSHVKMLIVSLCCLITFSFWNEHLGILF